MDQPNQPSGKALLEQYSGFEGRRRVLSRFRHIVSVDDDPFDGDVMKAMLHVCLGHDAEVVLARSPAAAVDLIRQRQPDLVFLDDYIGRTSNAEQNIGIIRKGGYAGPIVVVSALLSTKRRRELSAVGATATMHKDDLSSMTISEVLLQLAAE